MARDGVYFTPWQTESLGHNLFIPHPSGRIHLAASIWPHPSGRIHLAASIWHRRPVFDGRAYSLCPSGE
jgi:hypothetical protein